MFTFDNIITNKWFVVALIIALIVVIYLYSQKKCGTESMCNLDLITLPQKVPKYKLNQPNFKAWNRNEIGYHKYDETSETSDSDTTDENYPKPLDTRPDLSQCQPCKVCKPCN